MAKKSNRNPKTQANHDRNVFKSSHGKYKTAADMQAAGKANAKAKAKNKPENKTTDIS